MAHGFISCLHGFISCLNGLIWCLHGFICVFTGIFAYLNYLTPRTRAEILEILINGLKRLEYRGYDSAGMLTLSSDLDIDHPPVTLNRESSGLEVTPLDIFIRLQWWIQYFPEGGANSKDGVPTCYMAIPPSKLHENKRNWAGPRLDVPGAPGSANFYERLQSAESSIIIEAPDSGVSTWPKTGCATYFHTLEQLSPNP